MGSRYRFWKSRFIKRVFIYDWEYVKLRCIHVRSVGWNQNRSHFSWLFFIWRRSHVASFQFREVNEWGQWLKFEYSNSTNNNQRRFLLDMFLFPSNKQKFYQTGTISYRVLICIWQIPRVSVNLSRNSPPKFSHWIIPWPTSG